MFTLVIFPGFSPELWAERAPEQDSCRVPHRRAHTNKSNCLCAGGCGNAVTLLPFPPPPPSRWLLLSPSLFSSHTVLNLPQNEWAVRSVSSRFNKCCSPAHPLTRLTLFYDRDDEKLFSSLQTFQGTRPPQISQVSMYVLYEKVITLLATCHIITS